MLKFIEGFGLDSKYIFLVVGLLLLVYIFSIFDLQSTRVFGFMFATAPVWLPIITFFLAVEFWLEYVRLDYDIKQGRTTLEIKLPQEIFKSPEAMELVLTQIWNKATPDNHIQSWWDGKKPPKYGLEIVSRGGDVKFYINTPVKKFKNLIESQLYAQYPGIEVVELDVDYTAEIPWDLDTYEYFSLHFGLKKPDAYPLKTYVDYGMHAMPKEEEKNDPISGALETLGSINPDEFIWIQILIDGNREMTLREGSLRNKPDWRKEAKEEIEKIIADAAKARGLDDEERKRIGPNMLLTDEEKDTIKAIERSLGKKAYNTVIRGMYIAKKEGFIIGERMTPLINTFMPYDDLNRNAIGVRWRTDFDWNWWQDPTGRRRNYHKKRELREYKNRRYTSWNEEDKPKVFTTEELATIFHLPGKVAMTPTLGRIPSKRSEAPSNLPTE